MENLENNVVETTPEVGATEEVKTYTQEEVLAMVQRESDKRVTQALKTQQAKFDKQMSEAEKLRSMDETQQLSYKHEQALAQIEEMNRAKAIADNSRQATQILAERGLPVQFIDYVVAEDADTMMDNINKFDTAFKAAVSDAVSAKISSTSKTPAGATSAQTGLTKEQFNKMTISQQAELYNSNPTLYKMLSSK